MASNYVFGDPNVKGRYDKNTGKVVYNVGGMNYNAGDAGLPDAIRSSMAKGANAYPAPQPMPALGEYQGISTLEGGGKLGALPTLQDRLSTEGFDAFKSRALGTGPSPWLSMAEGKQRLEEGQAIESVGQAAAGQAAQARANLAMRGGLRGGAAERLAAGSADNAVLAQQGLRGQGMLARAGLGVEDERQKMQMLGQLPGMELSQAGYRTGLDTANTANTLGVGQFNIQNAIGDLMNKNEWDKFKYGEGMKLEGAKAASSAIGGGGKGGIGK